MSLTTVQNGMIGTVNSLTDSSGAVYGGLYGFRNRIINGAMMIDQRNAGASVSVVDGTYTLDRWAFYSQTALASKGTIQQNAGAVTPPAGFTKYLGFTSSSAYTVGAGEGLGITQKIEGQNISDLGWGASSASTVTLSFWVRSSLTGTFGGSIFNASAGRAYPYSYTISSANTWEQKSITIAGDTSGTWLTTNGIGMYVFFGLGVGSTYSGTAGAWTSSFALSATGATSVVGTNGATFYITGVQLEKGSTATSFDYRPYGTELALCQRYCPVWTFPSQYSIISNTFAYSTGTNGPMSLPNPVAVRSPVTGYTFSSVSHFGVSDGDSSTTCFAFGAGASGVMNSAISWVTSSGRTAFRPQYLFNNTAGAFIIGNGCEL